MNLSNFQNKTVWDTKLDMYIYIPQNAHKELFDSFSYFNSCGDSSISQAYKNICVMNSVKKFRLEKESFTLKCNKILLENRAFMKGEGAFSYDELDEKRTLTSTGGNITKESIEGKENCFWIFNNVEILIPSIKSNLIKSRVSFYIQQGNRGNRNLFIDVRLSEYGKNWFVLIN